MEAKNTLNGFEAILDTLNPHVGTKTKTEDNDTDVIDAAAEELTDEELEALRNPKPKKTTEIAANSSVLCLMFILDICVYYNTFRRKCTQCAKLQKNIVLHSILSENC